jgi:hypothetical protein
LALGRTNRPPTTNAPVKDIPVNLLFKVGQFAQQRLRHAEERNQDEEDNFHVTKANITLLMRQAAGMTIPRLYLQWSISMEARLLIR